MEVSQGSASRNLRGYRPATFAKPLDRLDVLRALQGARRRRPCLPGGTPPLPGSGSPASSGRDVREVGEMLGLGARARRRKPAS
eukprot:4597512-Pyramimonas_sp.AAC.1